MHQIIGQYGRAETTQRIAIIEDGGITIMRRYHDRFRNQQTAINARIIMVVAR